MGQDSRRVWLQVDSRGHATKLQESGEIAFLTNGSEIVQTEMLSDVSVRISKMVEGVDPLSPEWRITLKKGSVIDWASK